MVEQMGTLREHRTWQLFPLSYEQELIASRWVFRVNPKTKSTEEVFKAKLVAKVFQQKPSIDFKEIFAPVAKLSLIRLFLAYAHSKGLKLTQCDLKNSFLNGKLDENILYKQPEAFVDPNRPHHLCILNKTIDELKQVARGCYEALSTSLERYQMKPSERMSLSLYRNMHETDIWVVAYVDYLLIIAKDDNDVNGVRRTLVIPVTLKDSGRA